MIGVVDLTDFKRLNEHRVEPTAETFVDDEYAAIWTVENTQPRKRFHVAFMHALHADQLYKGLAALGLPLGALIKPPTLGQCVIEENGERCPWINTGGHYPRHMDGHLPKGVGFYSLCPACGHCTRRGDMFRRHAMVCSVRHGVEEDSLVYDADQNTFLR